MHPRVLQEVVQLLEGLVAVSKHTFVHLQQTAAITNISFLFQNGYLLAADSRKHVWKLKVMNCNLRIYLSRKQV